MWQIISPNSSCSSEPIELKRLKLELANNVCKCKICVDHEKLLLASTRLLNKETQIRDTSASSVRIINKNQSLGFPENTLCPGCYMALNFLQNKDTKVLKDEESETKSEMFSCDKSTEKKVKFLEKATSMTNRLSTPNYSNITFCDTMTEYSTDVSLYPVKSTKRRNQVSFIENQKEQINESSYFGNCFCMENFINSIRPPLVDCDI